MATTAQPKTLTFEQFLEQYPEDGRYELVNGKIVRILRADIDGMRREGG